jgi:hypothetical protein
LEYQGTKTLTQPIYDTVVLTASANQTQTFFANPLQSILTGTTVKTYSHTNLVQNAMLEKGRAMVIDGISLFVNEMVGTTRATWADILVAQMGHLNLIIGGTSMLRLPVAQVPAAGAELSLFSNITAAVTEWHANRGAAVINNRFSLQYPLDLPENTAVAVEITVPGTIAAVTAMTCVLWGTQTRLTR